jgi:hypothetical protein
MIESSDWINGLDNCEIPTTKTESSTTSTSRNAWVVLCIKLKDRLGNKRGGSECEPIKILLEWDDFPNKTNSVGHPKSHAPHSTLRLPKPRSHWSAIGPRNKHYQQPQLLHAHGSGNNSGAGCLEGAVRPGMWTHPPSNREILWNTSSEHQNAPRFHVTPWNF